VGRIGQMAIDLLQYRLFSWRSSRGAQQRFNSLPALLAVWFSCIWDKRYFFAVLRDVADQLWRLVMDALRRIADQDENSST